MSGSFGTNLKDLGGQLPNAPAENYVPFVQVDNIVYFLGQISTGPDGLIKSKLSHNMTTEDRLEALKACAINFLAQVKAAYGGDLDRPVSVIKLTGFLNSTADYIEQPQVINGTSNFIGEALGDVGKHARATISASSLPLGIAVEIEGLLQIA